MNDLPIGIKEAINGKAALYRKRTLYFLSCMGCTSSQASDTGPKYELKAPLSYPSGNSGQLNIRSPNRDWGRVTGFNVSAMMVYPFVFLKNDCTVGSVALGGNYEIECVQTKVIRSADLFHRIVVVDSQFKGAAEQAYVVF